MMHEVITTVRFEKEFKKLDRYTQRIIKSWVERNLVDCSNPRQHGKPLKANKSG